MRDGAKRHTSRSKRPEVEEGENRNSTFASIVEISMRERRVFFTERHMVFVGGIKNHRGFAATVLLVPDNYGLNKTNIFLIAPSYKKTPHECKGLHCRFAGGFFEGLINV